jgi:uncharacterized delta-60 repeat protein
MLEFAIGLLAHLSSSRGVKRRVRFYYTWLCEIECRQGMSPDGAEPFRRAIVQMLTTYRGVIFRRVMRMNASLRPTDHIRRVLSIVLSLGLLGGASYVLFALLPHPPNVTEAQSRHQAALPAAHAEPGAVGFVDAALTVDEGVGSVTITLRRAEGGVGDALVLLEVGGGTADEHDHRGLIDDQSWLGYRAGPIVQLPDGKIVIGGTFTQINGVLRHSVARFNADAGLDLSFDPGVGPAYPDYAVHALAVQPDGKLLVAGDYGHWSGQLRYSLVRLNYDGSLDSTFTPPERDGSIWEIVVQDDGKLLIAGDFAQVGGVPRSAVARLNADGSLDATFVPALQSGFVAGLALQPDGKVLVGGGFDRVSNQERRNFARLHADGSLDQSFAVLPFDERVREITLQPDGRILVSGRFQHVGAERRPYVARLNGDGALDHTFAPLVGPDAVVLDIAPGPNDTVVIGGEFRTVDGHRQAGIARLNADGSLDRSFDPGIGVFPGHVHTVRVLDDGSVLAAGSFVYVDHHRSVRFARLNPDGTPDPTVSVQVSHNNLIAWYDDASGERTFTFQIVDDGQVEDDETLVLGLITSQLIEPAPLVITIRDNDTPSPIGTLGPTATPIPTTTPIPTPTPPTPTLTAEPGAETGVTPTPMLPIPTSATAGDAWPVWLPLLR